MIVKLGAVKMLMIHPEHPKLEEHGWTLESAEERHTNAPGSFHIPSRNERESLEIGRRVQLLFNFLNRDEIGEIIDCEKMWVTIESVQDNFYTGCLANLPATSDLVAPGDIVTFRAEHISSIMIPKTDPRHPQYRSHGAGS